MICSKRSVCKKFFCLVLAFVLSLSTLQPVAAFASSGKVYESSITLTGSFDSKRFNLSTSGDLFSLKDIVPGDAWQGRIHIKNSCSETMEVSLVSIVNNLKSDTFLFDQLEMELFLGPKQLYSGAYGDIDSSVSAWHAIEPEAQITFDVKVKLPETTGNEGQGRKMDSSWIFEARIPEPISNSPSDSSQVTYIVYYVDSEMNSLMKPKTGYGKAQSEITEYAISVPGYTPDAEKKTIVLSNTGNSIYFIYKKTETSEGPAAQTPADPSVSIPKPDKVKTGDDLTESNTGPVFGWVILFSCGLAVIVTGFRIIQAKKQYVNKEDREL